MMSDDGCLTNPPTPKPGKCPILTAHRKQSGVILDRDVEIENLFLREQVWWDL